MAQHGPKRTKRPHAGEGERMPAVEAPASLEPAPGLRNAIASGGWLLQGFRSWILASDRLRLLELAAVVLWALYFTRPYLDMDPAVVPAGREYLSAIQTHTVWERVRACGLCGLWFGNVRGGFPALVDPVASTLHPLVIFATLAWGVVNGSKAALVGVFILAGLSQWWLGSLLGLRWPARVWGAVMAVSAGYLAARMDLGAFSLVLSTASAVPVFPAVIGLARDRTWRRVFLLAIVLALLAVGGTGYMQVGMVLVMPTALLLIPWDREAPTQMFRRLVLAVGMALLFAGPFLVPFVHFLPQFAKDFDVTFRNSQPFAYVPLNLVIRDVSFYLNDALGKSPWPSHFVNFVGWIPILLALYGLFGFGDAQRRRQALFLGVAAFLALWAASAMPFIWLLKIVKGAWFAQLIGGLRYTSFIAGLAVPPILGLASMGLDRLLAGGAHRFRMSLERAGAALATLSVDVRWLLVIPLVIAVNQARLLSSIWISIRIIDPPVLEVVEALQTPGLEWVNVPFGEHFFVTPAIERDVKLSADFFRTWHWKDRPVPAPVLEANRDGPPAGMTELSVVDGVHIHAAAEGQTYASVVYGDGTRTACRARGMGGDIDVSCDAAAEGTLVVEENNWSGWQALVDGEPAQLLDGGWLSVKALEGTHTYSFRYRPWDVPLGVALLMIGVLISGWILVRESRQAKVA